MLAALRPGGRRLQAAVSTFAAHMGDLLESGMHTVDAKSPQFDDTMGKYPVCGRPTAAVACMLRRAQRRHDLTDAAVACVWVAMHAAGRARPHALQAARDCFLACGFKRERGCFVYPAAGPLRYDQTSEGSQVRALHGHGRGVVFGIQPYRPQPQPGRS